MNAFSAFFVILLATGAARADMIKLATLDIACVEEKLRNPQVIKIVSNQDGSWVTVDKKTYTGSPLSGGTEGGAPYLQAVNTAGGFNITIEGGSFEQAFKKSSAIKDGTAKASVDLFSKNKSFSATCTGFFAFDR